MPNSPANAGAKIQNIITAWQTLAPAATFAGMTLDQFKAEVKPSFDARDSLSQKEAETTTLINQRNDADAASLETCASVVNAVKGDTQFGEDSGLYETMGYVRKSERRSGLTRKGTGTTNPDTQPKP